MSTKPFSNSHFIGYVKRVSPEVVIGHIPASRLLSLYHHYGDKYHSGIVGSFVVIEGEEMGFLGRVLEIDVAEKERSSLTEASFETEELQPQAKIEILLSFDYFEPEKVSRGLDSFPHVGAKIYGCTTKFLQQQLLRFGSNDKTGIVFDLGKLTADDSVEVSVSPQSLFGRHCAIVGTTGGGKSWTVAKILEEFIKHKGKVVLIDATGEYEPLDELEEVTSVDVGKNSYLHYSNLSVSDLFYLLRPSDKVQKPKLMEAIRSLKAVSINHGNNIEENYVDASGSTVQGVVRVEQRVLRKAGQNKKAYDLFCYNHFSDIESPKLDFEVSKLSRQVVEECIWDTDRSNPLLFGARDEGSLAYCTSLVSRINNLVNAANFRTIFGFDIQTPDGDDLMAQIDAFLSDDNKKVFRINLSGVSFEYQTREILADAIGRQLHSRALKGDFKNEEGVEVEKQSLTIIIDEAHQFMNKTVQDEYSPVQPLDAYERIAKETRKFGLFLCLATQMPRDIPLGTLSQMGTFIIHRLINRFDKEAVQSACSTANQASMSFLPVLGSGEAILLSIELPMPISIKVNPPIIKPNSTTPPVVRTRIE